jgi:6-phosphogluconolactonase
MSLTYDLRTFKDGAELAAAAAKAWLLWLESAPGDATVALSGGRNAREFFTEVCRQLPSASGPLSKARFFWSDERCVPPDSAESNFALANQFFLLPAGVDCHRIHRVEGELAPADAVARANAMVDRAVARNEAGMPVFDWVMLGLGEDGHVASLFPNASKEVLECTSAYVQVDHSPKPPPDRVSLTFKALQAAREVWVLAAGASKRPALIRSLAPEGDTPLARLLRQRAMTRIFCDTDLSVK